MEFAKVLIALAALINPLGAIPAFISLSEGQSTEGRRQTIRTAALATFLVIAASAVGGQYLLAAFGISIPSLQVGGGILLFLLAISMFNAQLTVAEHPAPGEHGVLVEKANIAVVPLTIPLLTGPGTVSTVIIYADQARSISGVLLLLAVGALIAVSVWVAFSLAGPISRMAGRTGLNIMTRLMGLVLAALAVEFVVAGLKTYLASF